MRQSTTKIWKIWVENQIVRKIKQEICKKTGTLFRLIVRKNKVAALRLELTKGKEYGEENPDHHSEESSYVAILWKIKKY